MPTCYFKLMCFRWNCLLLLYSFWTFFFFFVFHCALHHKICVLQTYIFKLFCILYLKSCGLQVKYHFISRIFQLKIFWLKTTVTNVRTGHTDCSVFYGVKIKQNYLQKGFQILQLIILKVFGINRTEKLNKTSRVYTVM